LIATTGLLHFQLRARFAEGGDKSVGSDQTDAPPGLAMVWQTQHATSHSRPENDDATFVLSI
jgi:hypothetical protein